MHFSYQEKTNYPTLYPDLFTRMITASVDGNLLVVAWHGPHKNKLQFQNWTATKETILSELGTFLLNFGNQEGLSDVLLAGDFNLAIDLARVEGMQVVPYEKRPPRDRRPKVLDYFMTTPNVGVNSCQYLLVKSIDPEREEQTLDHVPVFCEFVKPKGRKLDKPTPGELH